MATAVTGEGNEMCVSVFLLKVLSYPKQTRKIKTKAKLLGAVLLGPWFPNTPCSFLFCYVLCSPMMSYVKARDDVFLFINVREKNIKAPVSDRSM